MTKWARQGWRVEAMKTKCGVAVLQKNSKWSKQSKQSSNWNWGRAASPFATSNIKSRRSLTAEIPSAGMNTLRIWGGGIFMPDEFYDTCDELGLIVAGPHMTALAKNAKRALHFYGQVSTCCKKHPEKHGKNLWFPVIFLDFPLNRCFQVFHDMMYAQLGHAPAKTVVQDTELRHQVETRIGLASPWGWFLRKILVPLEIAPWNWYPLVI